MQINKHPTLREVIEENIPYEWMSLEFCGFGIADQVDATDFADESSVEDDLSFWLKGAACKSEFHTYSFEAIRINLSSVDEHDVEYLVGERPLGLINYYDSENVQINLPLKSPIYKNLFLLVASDISSLNIRIAIPIWREKEAKVLPILKYQLFYEKDAI